MCKALTKKGEPCKNKSEPYCDRHRRQIYQNSHDNIELEIINDQFDEICVLKKKISKLVTDLTVYTLLVKGYEKHAVEFKEQKTADDKTIFKLKKIAENNCDTQTYANKLAKELEGTRAENLRQVREFKVETTRIRTGYAEMKQKLEIANADIVQINSQRADLDTKHQKALKELDVLKTVQTPEPVDDNQILSDYAELQTCLKNKIARHYGNPSVRINLTNSRCPKELSLINSLPKNFIKAFKILKSRRNLIAHPVSQCTDIHALILKYT